MGFLEFDTISAFISVDGQAQEVYAVEALQTNAISCWIASEPGKKFAVKWHNALRAFPLEGVVTIDGVLCADNILLDVISYPTRANDICVSYTQTSCLSRRDFMFSPIEVTDDDAYLHTVHQAHNFGTITLELWRYQPTNVVAQPVIRPAVLEGRILHEKSKKAGAHHVKYSDEYFSPAPVVNVVSGFRVGTSPYVTFTFKYRPMAMLMANGIVPRPLAPPATNPVKFDAEVIATIRALETQLQELRQKVGLDDETPQPLPASRRVKMEPELPGMLF
ncbi:hypothetical protein Hypma_010729 [Hypsizygus marmoreus]|uniref:DUF7918 domain-containing protein n=1 Tax=Hypsizygus marmoreus TaxID=39966 RepID=A0A369JJ18_HYPMA|nr:hypothetical protein Hypma_010729 [Hypsizygus marmoreus]